MKIEIGKNDIISLRRMLNHLHDEQCRYPIMADRDWTSTTTTGNGTVDGIIEDMRILRKLYRSLTKAYEKKAGGRIYSDDKMRFR